MDPRFIAILSRDRKGADALMKVRGGLLLNP
jgi:hypothetical protein